MSATARHPAWAPGAPPSAVNPEQEIRRALQVLTKRGGVFEIRIPEAGKAGTVSGYFNDPDKAADAVVARDGQAPGVYVTLNPVSRDLLSRANNRLQERARATTADPDITERRLLLFDIDPERPTGISATDSEKALAVKCAEELRAHLAAKGWPAPVESDSGNGAHLFYRVDLPNDSDAKELVRRVLNAAAARFDTPRVHLDTTVGNAARIVKLPGTLACKGDSTAERPHRRARLTRVPSVLSAVPRELLEVFAANAPARSTTVATDAPARSLDVADWIAKHNIKVKRGPEAYNGGRRWILGKCPFNDQHATGSDTALFQDADGTPGFKCQHNGCADKGWADFRARYESPPEVFEENVAREVQKIRVREEAQRRVKALLTPPQPFDAVLLAEVADEPVRWRVRDLLAAEGRLLLAAQRKTGKTTAALNLARDLLLGGDFLGRFHVEPIVGRVAFLNFEVAKHQLARWARETGIPGDRLLTVHLRGRGNPFSAADDTARLAEVLRSHSVEVAIVDPFGRAYTGKSQNDPGEVGAFLAELDRFADAAGCSELILTAHAGWEGERTRGASALEDWADTIATLVRDRDDERLRFFHAKGRDVEVEEDRLTYDQATRRLTLTGTGSRASARNARRTEELIAGIVEAVTKEPGATTARLEEMLREGGVGVQHSEVGRAAKAAADAGRVTRVAGPRRSQLHFLPGQEPQSFRVVPSRSSGTSGVVPTSLYREGTTPVLLTSRAGVASSADKTDTAPPDEVEV
ncbi:MAG TPA: AAA family ATPase [Thermoanaerobaculaceae bacterium]|nr:AAA family ATPase [Thermoanaerobaculaceae bacterium]